MMKITSAFKKDFLASIPVFCLSVPLNLGLAHACGVPLIAGLWSGIIGGLIVASLSHSRVGIVGPAAGLTAITLTCLRDLGSFEALMAAVMIAGILQMVLSYFKAGFLFRFVPSSVMKGMMSALGIVLILNEIPHLVGEFDLPNRFFDLMGTPGVDAAPFHLGSLAIGICSLLAYLAWWKKPIRKLEFIPPALMSVFVGAILGLLFSQISPTYALQAEHLIQMPSVMGFRILSEGNFGWSNFGLFANPLVYQSAFMIMLVASIEGMLSIQLLDQIDPRLRRTPLDRELLAQGLGNFCCGIFGGLPLTSVLARGTVNLNSGAQTRRSAQLQGLFLLLSVLFFLPLMNIIPISALAAVLIVTGFRLSQVDTFPALFRRGAYQYVPFLVTVFGISFFGLLFGIVAGLITAGLFLLRSSYYDSAFQFVKMGRVHRLTLGEDVSFLLKPKLSDVLSNIPRGSIVEIDGSKSKHIDSDVIETLALFIEQAKSRNIEVVVGGIPALAHLFEEFFESMDEQYKKMLANNKVWVDEKNKNDPEFFKKLSLGQSPQFLFIGCSDSRVPLETITKAEPGDMFIHRNIANIVNLSDINFLSVLQYSVEVLNVRHIVVCGHYGCGGVRAALSHKSLGLIDNWILSVKMSVKDHAEELNKLSEEARERRAIELHVIQQVKNLYKNPVVQNAVVKYGFPKVHGWVYDLKTGLIDELDSQVLPEPTKDEIFEFRP